MQTRAARIRLCLGADVTLRAKAMGIQVSRLAQALRRKNLTGKTNLQLSLQEKDRPFQAIKGIRRGIEIRI
jgi:hypothetical protein